MNDLTLQDVLRSGTQCDEDGTAIIMSRQACHEAADLIDALRAKLQAAETRIAELEAADLHLRLDDFNRVLDGVAERATVAALRWAWHNQSLDLKPYIKRGLTALLGEGE